MRSTQLADLGRRRGVATRLVAVATAMLMLAPIGTSASALAADSPMATQTVVQSVGQVDQVVVAPSAGLAEAAAAVAEQGGQVVQVLAGLGLLVAEVPSDTIDALRADGRMSVVSHDRPLGLQSSSFDQDDTNATTATIHAVEAWENGHDGGGIGIAVVDTGIDTYHPDLAGRVTAIIDATPDAERGDTHGHGTFLASLAAGTGAGSDGQYTGVAPGAHLVSVRVADKQGRASMTSVLAGLEAVAVTADELGVRVVLLALSGPDNDPTDPLRIALNQLWARGLVVVVPSGNDGVVNSPGNDPWLLTTGALDTNATVVADDDSIPSWSGAGITGSGQAKPDVVAPGVSVVAALASGSLIERQNPDAIVQDGYIRGSGTSMAAAVMAGAAAVLLDADPSLTPDEVKGRFMATAAASPAGVNPQAGGHGVIDLMTAIESDAPAANQALAPIKLQVEQAPERAARDIAGPAMDHDKDEKKGSNKDTARGKAANVGGQIKAWKLSDGPGEMTAWNWTAWNWTAWNWTAWNWTAWNWTAWNWTAWNWTAESWG